MIERNKKVFQTRIRNISKLAEKTKKKTVLNITRADKH